MNRRFTSGARLAILMCSLFLMSQAALGGVVTMPAGFNWLLSDTEFGKVLGTPGVAEDIYQRGIELLYDGKFSEAAECFWRVIDLYTEGTVLRSHPRVSSAYYYLGKTYLLAGRPELSCGLFALALQGRPATEFLQAQVDLSQSYNDAERERLRGFAMDRQLDLELPGAAIREPAIWQETIPMDMLFDFNEYTLRPDALPILERLIDRIKSSAGLAFVIEANSDDVGTQEYNLWLGNKRAEAVRDAITSRGIESRLIKCFSYGKLLPIAPNDNEEGRYKNRRLVLKAVKQ
ncbi:MAG: OmpA family protein [Candidatus Coatesbacteria bacterium]|nr:OmpA family protein [Candidatus Coatesbacteria bacterium]